MLSKMPRIHGAKDAGHSDDRYRRTVHRIASEAFWLRTYQAAINGLRVEAVGLDFFRVSLSALKDARLIRLIRVLEDDSKTASFWYLIKCNQPLVARAASTAGLDLTELRNIAGRLRGIRDKTFVHIDKLGVLDPQQYYKDAGLNNDKMAEICDQLWETMKDVYVTVYGTVLPHDVYSGDDIEVLERLRDDAICK